MDFPNSNRERIATIMADSPIKQQAIEIGNVSRIVIYQRNAFVKEELRSLLIKTLGLGLAFKGIVDKLFPKEKESTAPIETKTELKTFDDVVDFFKKTIEIGFSGQESTPTEVAEYLLTSDESISPLDVSTGGMFIFKYEPTTKNDLKYYDALPLVIMVGRTNDGFIGLNLHYLPEKYRVAFLRKLFSGIDFSDINQEDEIDNRLQLASAYKFIKPVYKRYKYDGITSRMVRIPIENWLMASLMPMYKFQGKSKKEVWDDSRKIINDEERRV